MRGRESAVWSRGVATVAGGVSATLGVVVLVGWHARSVVLVQVHPAYVPMQYNTALAFLLCGAGLLALRSPLPRLPRFATVCGALAAAVGLLTLIEYSFGLDLGIDRLLLEPFTTVKTAQPGRMGPTTALCFALTGSALVALSGSRGPRQRSLIAGLCASVVLALGVATLLGYLTGTETPFGWKHQTYMAVHTAAGFAVLGTGVFALALREGAAEGAHAPHWLPFPIGTASVTVAVILWQALIAQQRAHIEGTVALEASSLRAQVEELIQPRVQVLVRMGGRWERRSGTPREEWEADAALYVTHQPDYRAIAWVDPSLRVRWITPREGNEAAQKLNLASEERHRRALRAARDRREVTVAGATGVGRLGQGERGLFLYVPLFRGDEFDGFMLGVLRVRELLDPVGRGATALGYSVAVLDGEEEIYGHYEPGRQHEEEWSRETALELYDLQWRIRAWPRPKMLTEERTLFPEMTFAVALLLAFLFPLTVRLGQTARHRARKAENLTQLLQQDISERQCAEEALRKAHEELRDLAARLHAVREQEKTASAREIHDEFGQTLTALKLDLAWLIDRLPEDREPLLERANSAVSLVDTMLDAARDLSYRLRPAVLDDLGLEAAIRGQAKEFEGRTGCRTELDIEVGELEFDRDRDTAIFRILQEALTNVARHSGARRVKISLRVDGDIVLAVSDDGRGISAKEKTSSKSLGLIGIRERARAFGGQVEIHRVSEEGGGMVRLRMPLSPKEGGGGAGIHPTITDARPVDAATP